MTKSLLSESEEEEETVVDGFTEQSEECEAVKKGWSTVDESRV
jgi:hypothetical protein